MKKLLSIALLIFIIFNPLIAYSAEEHAVLAGGCFWCLEHDLEELDGVSSVESGYSGGDSKYPTYRDHKGHQESVEVKFDPEIISYADLLRSFWRNIDPLDGEGQFCDRGDSYRPVIFAVDKSQREEALSSSLKASQELSKPKEYIKVEIKDLTTFWIAEDYHQNFATRNSLKYNFYRYSCGRDNRLKEVWGDKASSFSPWN